MQWWATNIFHLKLKLFFELKIKLQVHTDPNCRAIIDLGAKAEASKAELKRAEFQLSRNEWRKFAAHFFRWNVF